MIIYTEYRFVKKRQLLPFTVQKDNKSSLGTSTAASKELSNKLSKNQSSSNNHSLWQSTPAADSPPAGESQTIPQARQSISHPVVCVNKGIVDNIIWLFYFIH